MAAYRADFLDQAVRDLGQLDKVVASRIRRKLRWLCSNLDSITPEALTSELTGLFKLRVGDYRVLYEILRDRSCGRPSSRCLPSTVMRIVAKHGTQEF